MNNHNRIKKIGTIVFICISIVIHINTKLYAEKNLGTERISGVIGSYQYKELLTKQQLEKIISVTACNGDNGNEIPYSEEYITGKDALQQLLNGTSFTEGGPLVVVNNDGEEETFSMLPKNWDRLKEQKVYIKDFLPIAEFIFHKKGCPYDEGVGEEDNNIDTDLDGIIDRDDRCKDVKGPNENEGCPVFETKCTNQNDCGSGLECTGGVFGICIAPNKEIERCKDEGIKNIIHGEVQGCGLICPCAYKVDFRASLRKCDKVFGIISSSDGKEIYSKGKIFQIRP